MNKEIKQHPSPVTSTPRSSVKKKVRIDMFDLNNTMSNLLNKNL